MFCVLPYSALKECYSGHAFSDDGVSWNFSKTEPFGGIVEFTAGLPQTFSTRERPHLVFADEGRTTPSGVITSVSSQPVSPACDSCFLGACSQCKITKGKDWTYTLFEPFFNYKL